MSTTLVFTMVSFLKSMFVLFLTLRSARISEQEPLSSMISPSLPTLGFFRFKGEVRASFVEMAMILFLSKINDTWNVLTEWFLSYMAKDMSFSRLIVFVFTTYQ